MTIWENSSDHDRHLANNRKPQRHSKTPDKGNKKKDGQKNAESDL